MLRQLIQACAGLVVAVAVAGAAVAAPAPHFAAPSRGGRGSLGRSPAPSLGGRGSLSRPPAPSGRAAPLPRGGPGTLGQYYGRSPSVRSVPRSYPYYPIPYYDGFYASPFFFDPFFYDGFYPGYWDQSYGPGYYLEEGWSNRGNVQLHVDPKDVEVIVDGIPSANSGRAILNLPSGVHHFEIRRSGYRPWVLDLDVKQGVRYRLDQRLERLSKEEQESGVDRTAGRQVGELRLNVKPIDTIVDMDGRLLGMADLLHGSQTLRHIPPGPHTLRFTHPGYQAIEKQIDVTPDHPTEVTIDLQRE